MKLNLIAPSGALPDVSILDKGYTWFQEQGIEVCNLSCGHRQFQRFAGTDSERLDEINLISKLPSDSVVMSLRGGYGLSRLLKDIQWDAIASQVNKGLKIIGHSDFTSFGLALYAKTGASSFAGPMFAYDFCGDISAFTWKHYQQAIQDNKLDIQVLSPQEIETPLGVEMKDQSVLWGGNLTMLTSLLGTAYLPSLQQVSNGILFIEDVNEHPYRVERMLHQLFDAGYLSSQKAILIGDISSYKLGEADRGYSLPDALASIRNRLGQKIPVLTNLPFGHCADKLTLPLGKYVSLSASQSGYILKASW
ncbi:LD-carboxypeptidase [Polynucleobacter sp. MWH-Spelu-300-X4]|uniref:LD-carboxypeptidase n=1 Tax=Polynucleobacter sp. MWH-Spelu-300-X4 TaxID=2689109 RepID=UPI001BFE087E|nr:LD-carboxypeptidase [Polynucleobacter sp. MWH-Spelu-300-X4]QWD78959.1 LD-carboxypeptidase [Polynucleobacter sp. MWH-Spelu-300-X4]